MLQTSTMLNRLDMATRRHHGEADAPWLDLMTATPTRERYVVQLVKIYGFESPLEAALAYTPQVLEVVRRDRPRSGLIAQDLLALGLRPLTIAQLPQCAAIGSFADAAEALGWKYVADRATLLHASVKRHLLSRLPELADACAYLSASDDFAAASWHQLGARLDQVASTPELADRMIDAADAAFTSLCTWLAGEEVIRMTS